MKKVNSLLFLLFVLVSLNVNYAQEFSSSVTGVVLEEGTKAGIAGVNVFISETTWGTTTDKYGIYEIKNLPSGNHEIVVSIIGFEVATKNFNLEKGEKKNLDFLLKEKAYELETIEVVSERPENWDNNLAIFKTYFLGQGEFASDCKILNEEQLSFDLGAYKELYASADRPLKVKNNALGYDIEIVLISFKWDPKQGRVQYSIKPKFEELISDDKEQINRWNSNRKKAYFGSINHFFKCLKENNFIENGYSVYLVPRLNRNPQFVAHLSNSIERSSQVLKPGVFPGEDILTFGDRLEIQYSPTASELNVSWLDLNYNEITLDQFSYPEEYMPFQMIGYWAKLGIADWLPKYYNASATIK
ncbi:MAG: carboxypeptidase-like regulatory domain-containing protein [Bacteroidetes bacterium]|nr:carboxypeptidase-like regulatory domain-containing protein [Bacteroidota bacterium]